MGLRLIIVALIVICIGSGGCRQDLSIYTGNFRDEIENLYSSSTKASEFSSMYRSLLESAGARFETFDAIAELKAYAAHFGKIIETTKQALQAENVGYIDLRQLKLNDPRLTTVEKYPFKVFKGHSGVHVPVEVYGGDQLVFHALKWTGNLDYIFNQSRGLNFIYFASTSGIMRVYPAFSWEYKGVDLFDVRRRSWYNQGSAVPKDILLLLDT
ncbi:hypothetical protein FGIG_05406 [Fasciola gigantica]|uniref:VWA N-terminal domain-containing protein n=1 Tax=Fasciola gigantica TaxID=46835 RepID=A0A504Y9D0_FASGI|nr:hypothetical protein FGIG_05406 [Fasciola gigantica]